LRLEKKMLWNFVGILHLLTVILTLGYLLFHLVQVRRMPPAQSARYTGSLVIWLGAAILAASMILSDLKIGFGSLIGLIGFGLIVYGLYLNQQRDKRLSSTGGTGPNPPA